MIYNILNGDALADKFAKTSIRGDIVVVREALIDGNLSGETLNDFWKTRAGYIGIDESEYMHRVAGEFEKIAHAPNDSEFNLWFEYDLFCQVNMWFVLSIIKGLKINKRVFAVYTAHLDRANSRFWNGFGGANADDLTMCLSKRIHLNEGDIQFGYDLWNAYKNNDLDILRRLSMKPSPAFPYVEEAIEAHVDRFPKEGQKGRPEQVIEDIVAHISTDFDTVFREFWKRESIYGFGDIQVKQIYNKVMLNHQQGMIG